MGTLLQEFAARTNAVIRNEALPLLSYAGNTRVPVGVPSLLRKLFFGKVYREGGQPAVLMNDSQSGQSHANSRVRDMQVIISVRSAMRNASRQAWHQNYAKTASCSFVARITRASLINRCFIASCENCPARAVKTVRARHLGIHAVPRADA